MHWHWTHSHWTSNCWLNQPCRLQECEPEETDLLLFPPPIADSLKETRKSMTPMRELYWGMYLWANFNLKMAWDGERTGEGMCWVSELLSLKIVHHTKKVSLSPSSSCFSAFCQACRAGSQTGSEQKNLFKQLLFPKLQLNLKGYFDIWIWTQIRNRPKNCSLSWNQT